LFVGAVMAIEASCGHVESLGLLALACFLAACVGGLEEAVAVWLVRKSVFAVEATDAAASGFQAVDAEVPGGGQLGWLCAGTVFSAHVAGLSLGF
jgi:hypothetical protein